MIIRRSEVTAHTYVVQVDKDELVVESGKRLSYGTWIGTFSIHGRGHLRIWTPAASVPRGYRAAARLLLEEARQETLTGFEDLARFRPRSDDPAWWSSRIFTQERIQLEQRERCRYRLFHSVVLEGWVLERQRLPESNGDGFHDAPWLPAQPPYTRPWPSPEAAARALDRMLASAAVSSLDTSHA